MTSSPRIQANAHAPRFRLPDEKHDERDVEPAEYHRGPGHLLVPVKLAATVVTAAALALASSPAMADRQVTSQVDTSDPAQMAFTSAGPRTCEHQLVTRRTVGVVHYGQVPASWSEPDTAVTAQVVFKVRRDGVLRRSVVMSGVTDGQHVSISPGVRQGHEKTVEVYVDGAFVGSTGLRPLDDCPDF